MKPRNREINIFNMSLLDILCGALGTFCFLMLVLFPYYSIGKNAKQAPEVPPGVDPKTLEDAKARIQQLEETLKKFQDFAREVQNQLTAAQAENNQLKDQLKSARKYADQLEFRNPFIAVVNYIQRGASDAAELYVEDTRHTEDGKKHTPKVDPTKEQPVNWGGDQSAGGFYIDYYLVRDTPPGKYRILLKVMKHDTAAGPLVVQGSITSSLGVFQAIPRFYVRDAQTAVELGVVTITEGDKGYIHKIDITLAKELQQPPGGGQDKGSAK